MTVILQGIRLHHWQVELLQSWTEEYNQLMANQSWSVSNSTADIPAYVIQRTDRLFNCVHSSYFAPRFPLRECLLKLIGPDYRLPTTSAIKITTPSTVLKTKLSVKEAKDVVKCYSMQDATAPSAIINKKVEVKPTSIQIDNCLHNPTTCRMNVTLNPLELEPSQLETLQKWLERFLFHVQSDDDDEQQTTTSSRDPLAEYEVTRAFEMLACIRAEVEVKSKSRSSNDKFNLKECLMRLLKKYAN